MGAATDPRGDRRGWAGGAVLLLRDGAGLPVISLSGTPGTRWERPGVVSAIEAIGLRLVVPDRPGYGGSARQPGHTVADVVADVRAVAAAQGWARFAVTGGATDTRVAPRTHRPSRPDLPTVRPRTWPRQITGR